jgi:hypothetical protein
MQTRPKLALLELIGGLFGWVWIIASVASIYFLVAALAFNGRWSNLFWALGAGVVAKWLARGFKDHQKRIASEAELVSRGASPTEAREAWLTACTQGAPASVLSDGSQISASGHPNDTALLAAQEIVNKYGAVLEHSKTITQSEAVLPVSKEQIKGALVALARHAKASGASRATLEPLRGLYASLADFVSERDANAATTFDNLATAGATELDDAELRELAGKIAASGAGALDVKRASTEEFARLIAEFDERLRE